MHHTVTPTGNQVYQYGICNFLHLFFACLLLVLFSLIIFCLCRWVCEEIPDLKLPMDKYVLNGYDTKR